MASKEVERKPAQKKSRFKTIRVFLVFYTLARLCVQAAYTYSSGVNTTIERNFGFSSRMIGTFSVVKEIITIACIALQIVFGGRIHVPILMGVGVAMCGPASLLHALPYLIYGKPTDTPHPGTNQTGSEFCAWRNMTEDCNGRDGSLATPTVVAYVIFLVNNFVAGISSSSMAILFVPYIHLNAKNSKESAFLIGWSSGFFSLSFFLGSFMASAFTSIHIDLKETSLSPTDPSWLGAWWLGSLVLGGAAVFFSIPLFFFPRRIQPEESDSNTNEQDGPQTGQNDSIELKEENSTPVENSARNKENPSDAEKSVKSFPRILLGVFCNPAYLCVLVITVVTRGRFAGFAMFFVKIMEAQFRQTTWLANLFQALATGLFGTFVGKILMGTLAAKFNKIRQLALYVLVVVAVMFAGSLVQLFLGCDTRLVGDLDDARNLNMTQDCNMNCSCTTRKFNPVCGEGGSSYFSPCYAGCTNESLSDCACVSTLRASKGWCGTCPTFIAYVAIWFLLNLANGMLNDTLLTPRVLTKEQTTVGVGVQQLFLHLLGILPVGVIFGSLIDSTCSVWQDLGCGETGTCWFYDSHQFFIRLHGMALALMAIGTLAAILLCVIVWKHVDDESKSREIEDKINEGSHEIIRDSDGLGGKSRAFEVETNEGFEMESNSPISISRPILDNYTPNSLILDPTKL